jgi:altronate dehydratase small subunit
MIGMAKAIQIDDKDNVATVTTDVDSGEIVDVISPNGKTILKPKVSETIPFGHKLAIKSIRCGEDIVKYGETIGVASMDISAGAWVHTQNVGSARMPSKGKEVGIL